jgi:hypothetical protein
MIPKSGHRFSDKIMLNREGVGNMGVQTLQRRPLAVQGALASLEARQRAEHMIRSPAFWTPGVKL